MLELLVLSGRRISEHVVKTLKQGMLLRIRLSLLGYVGLNHRLKFLGLSVMDLMHFVERYQGSLKGRELELFPCFRLSRIVPYIPSLLTNLHVSSQIKF